MSTRALLFAALLAAAAVACHAAAGEVIAIKGAKQFEKVLKKHPFIVVEVRRAGPAARRPDRPHRTPPELTAPIPRLIAAARPPAAVLRALVRPLQAPGARV
jgi:hypothetical protein